MEELNIYLLAVKVTDKIETTLILDRYQLINNSLQKLARGFSLKEQGLFA